METGAVPQVLVVEDNPGDVRLIQESLGSSGWQVALHVVHDGAEALGFLNREGGHAEAPRPDLILLDLNLPGLDGREVLRRVKSQTSLCAIPTVVLTSSRAPEDVHAAYSAHANCYVQKPLHLDGFCAALTSIRDFWFTTTVLPSNQ